MDDVFIIYIDRLKNEGVENITAEVLPDFLQISEKNLEFRHPVHICGKVYMAQDTLIINLDIKTKSYIPCSICCNLSEYPIDLVNLYATQALDEIKQTYNLAPLIRENIILQCPQFIECNQGNCPERAEIAPYLKTAKKEGHCPFTTLN